MWERVSILERLPFEIGFNEAIKEMNLRTPDPAIRETLVELIDKARKNARPKALYKVSFMQAGDEASVDIDGIRFTSRVLRKSLEHGVRVFPYIVSVGVELGSIAVAKDDYLSGYLLEGIKEMILERAVESFEQTLGERYALESMAHMNPGSLDDWPIEQQRELFSLLGDAEERIGVRLSPTCLMDPIKSVSGIYFPTQTSFTSCMLCPRHPCSKRKAEYDPEKF